MVGNIWKIAKLTLLSFSVVVLASIGGSLAYRSYRHHELFKTAAIDQVNGIDEAFFARIGGIEQ